MPKRVYLPTYNLIMPAFNLFTINIIWEDLKGKYRVGTH